MDASTEAVEVSPEVARALARALGIAWMGATLYENPLEQEAFGKAAEKISTLAPTLPAITVTPRTLRLGDRDLGEGALSIEKMAHSCFIHGIGLVRLTGEVTPRSLATFMEVIQLDPETVAHDGGLARLLKRRLVLGVEVFAHSGAMEQADQLSGWDERWGWSADSLTAVLESTPPVDLGPRLKEGFEGARSLASVKERQAAVTSHVEALMNLRPGTQAELLDWLMERDDAAVTAVFDHLATHELLRLSGLLAEPARGGALQLLDERGVEDPAWRPVDLAEVTAALGDDLPALPPASEWRSEMGTVLTCLLDSDLGRDDQGKLIEVWASLFDSMLGEGSFSAAQVWMDLPGHQEDADLRARVENRRHRMPSREGIRALVKGTVAGDGTATDVLFSCLQAASVHVFTLLGALPDDLVGPVLNSLARRVEGWEGELLDQLPGLERPLSLALGLLAHSGFDGTGDERLLAFVNHDSADVRAAALRLVGDVVPIERLTALVRDPSQDVQRLAVALLATKGEAAVAPLAEALLSLELSDAVATTVGRTLRDLPGGARVLDRTAQDVQLLVSGAGRSLRKLLVAIVKEKA